MASSSPRRATTRSAGRWGTRGHRRRPHECIDLREPQMRRPTVLAPDETVKPGDDLPAGSEFALYGDTYPLPADYTAQDQSLLERNFGGMDYTHPWEWL